MSLIHPVKKVYITQKWGVNADIYKRFGLSGHNGVDYRIFSEAGNRAVYGRSFAPHDGKIIEAYNDGAGYGWYVKIENDKEGSILAHHKELLVKIGDTVEQGDMIGITDNTGWSTGPHLHWGYYLKPRNKANGYSGTINQLLLIGKDMSELQEIFNYFGIENKEELINKSVMHLGQHEGRCDWGSSEDDRGGFLGSERREVIKLKKQLGLHVENVMPSEDPNPDPEKWELNGLQVTVLDSGARICEYNYKKK